MATQYETFCTDSDLSWLLSGTKTGAEQVNYLDYTGSLRRQKIANFFVQFRGRSLGTRLVDTYLLD